jgi:hypothetical protein
MWSGKCACTIDQSGSRIAGVAVGFDRHLLKMYNAPYLREDVEVQGGVSFDDPPSAYAFASSFSSTAFRLSQDQRKKNRRMRDPKRKNIFFRRSRAHAHIIKKTLQLCASNEISHLC